MKLSLFILITLALYSAAHAQIKITSTGDVGIGTETPSHTLSVVRPTTSFIHSNKNPLFIELTSTDPRFLSDNKVVFYNLTQTGPIQIQASAFSTISDERMKTNIQGLSATDLKASPLHKILQLNGYTYQWKHEVASRKAGTQEPQKQTGFLAQEVEKLFPEAVTASNDSTEMKAVTYHQIIPYLVEAIKEQQVMIDELKKELNLRNDQKSTAIIDPRNQTTILPTKNEK